MTRPPRREGETPRRFTLRRPRLAYPTRAPSKSRAPAGTRDATVSKSRALTGLAARLYPKAALLTELAARLYPDPALPSGLAALELRLRPAKVSDAAAYSTSSTRRHSPTRATRRSNRLVERPT